jgi:hypothetical protein
MKSMDNAARTAMLPDYIIYCADLSEGNGMIPDMARQWAIRTLALL